MATKQQQNQRLGENIWTRMPKVNAELFTLTYGALISQLIQDLEDVNEINKKLEKMGHNIGVRIIDEFLAKSGTTNCSNFRDTADMIAKVAFKMFLGITAEVGGWTGNENGQPSSSSVTTTATNNTPALGNNNNNNNNNNNSGVPGFTLILNDNPFTEFVELPPMYSNLHYCNLLCGVIRGALEMVQLQVECRFTKDILKGDDTTEIRVELKGVMTNTMSEEYSREN